MTVREMTAREVFLHFGDMGRHGLIAELDGSVCGFLAFNTEPNAIYVHSLFSPDGGYPAMAIWLRSLAKDLNLPLKWMVNADNADMLHFAKSGHAEIVAYVLQSKDNNQ